MRSRRWVTLGALLALGVAAGWYGLRPAGRPERPDVVLIVVDSLRADRVGENPTSPMPFVAKLAASGVRFERAYAASSWTLPSVASLLTARYPSQHGARWWGHPIPEAQPTLAAVLRAQGYVTAAFSAHSAVGPRHGLDRGFDAFEIVGDPQPFRHTDAGAINAAVLAWVKGAVAAGKPYFVYLHYMDVHYPYRPHPGLTAPRQQKTGLSDLQLSANASKGGLEHDARKRADLWAFDLYEQVRLRELYDGAARHLDEKLAELLAALDAVDARERIVIVTADHGEEFGEHGLYGHGSSLHEATVHVPLVVSLPDAEPRRVSEPVSLAGLAPAVLAELSIDAPDTFHVPAFDLRGEHQNRAPGYAYVELLDTGSLPLHVHERGLVGEHAKLLETPAGDEVLYVDDPLERAPRRDEPLAGTLRRAMSETRRGLDQPSGAPAVTPTVVLDPTMREQLRALGYLGDE
jgi:arylsulfatase A-like enzyme